MSSNYENECNNADAFCVALMAVFFYMFIMLSWLIVYDTGSEKTKSLLMWDSLTDDPLIAWYMSSKW